MTYKPFIDKKAILKLRKRVTHTALPVDHISNEIMDRLLERLDIIKIQPSRILLIGWQMDLVSKKIAERYSDAKIIVVSNLDAISSLENNSFEMVISHCALLCEREPLQLLHEMHRVLSDEGLLLFTTLGPDTLYELNNSFLCVDQFFHVHPFTDMHDIGDWLRSLHFSDPVMDREEITLAYEDLNLLFEDLKIVGATNAHELRYRGLFPPRKWRLMLDAYEKYKVEDYYPATVEVIYGHGWKVKLGRSTDGLKKEVLISIDSIKRK